MFCCPCLDIKFFLHFRTLFVCKTCSKKSRDFAIKIIFLPLDMIVLLQFVTKNVSFNLSKFLRSRQSYSAKIYSSLMSRQVLQLKVRFSNKFWNNCVVYFSQNFPYRCWCEKLYRNDFHFVFHHSFDSDKISQSNFL
jgi:hypothetical protein